MSSSYEAAKRVALGLERGQEAPVVDDLWSVSFGADFSLRTEMPFQFFEKGFEPPDEQTAQKAALMLFEEEFAADQKAAEERFRVLRQSLAASDLDGVQRLLAEAPPVGWLSLIFLEGETLWTELVPALESADEPCRTAFSQALDAALEQLVDFKDLMETLRKHC